MTTFRIDDIGASTKHFEQHGRKWFSVFGKKVIYFPLANVWFFKRIWPFRRWGKYDELTVSEWQIFLEIFLKHNIVPIIAITATWVEKDSTLTPFPQKFPEQANLLKDAFLKNKIIIANHGLTHCVVGQHLPRFWTSNRSFHREFLPALDETVHRQHIVESQAILEQFFEKPVEIFVPPGNLWSIKTYKALCGTNIKKVMCSTYMADSKQKMEDVEFISDAQRIVPFHDRELKLYGVKWLRSVIDKNI